MIFGLLTVHFMFFAVVGLFCRKKYPATEEKLRYGIIIPARNEESVVSGLIESIQKNNYPQDKLQIFVIAHNSTDKTAEIARNLGATVYEYNNPKENTMGYAFRHLFSCIEKDFGTKNFDGFFLFNADNILDKDYISKMNDAFQYYGKQSVVTSFRNSKNFGSNLISGLYGMYFSVGCRMESCGRTVMGCSTRVQGTGYLVSPEIVEKGWKYVTLAEDWEFTADQILLENNIKYCDEAVFYDEQPTSIPIMWRQRVRWSRGHLLVFYTRIKELIKSLFVRKTKHKFSHFDIMINVLPMPLFILAVFIIQAILFLTAPLVDPSADLRQIFIGDLSNWVFSNGILFHWLRAAIISTVSMWLSGLIIFTAERKRIKGVSLWHKILISLFWPLFILIQFPMDIQALFSKNLGWKPIPHSDQTSFEHVNEPSEEEKAEESAKEEATV
ncbi:MAG: glycosyltransferase family 2 protein [Clostridia bacterium]|nr:glycosyltransferase family 2 protein [Clostridia bacterium]